jgi:hypothetical protein
VDGLVAGGQVEDAVEHEPAAACVAPVEAEHELIEVGLQVGGVDRALLGAEQPPLGERRDPVHCGQHLEQVLAAPAGGALAVADAAVAERLRLWADMPSFCVANNQHAMNHTVSGVRVRSKIVPAVTEVAERHAAQRNRPSPGRQPPSPPHAGHTKSAGQGSHSR